MKISKIFIVSILFILIISGCKNDKLAKEKEIYQKSIKDLKQIKESSNEVLPFNIETKYDKITKNEVRYQVIIDKPKEEIKEISALVIHNKQTDDIFPSVGIFDKKENLVPNKKPSGIILVGYIPYQKDINKFSCNLKILIRYSTNNKTKTVYYVTKKLKN